MIFISRFVINLRTIHCQFSYVAQAIRMFSILKPTARLLANCIKTSMPHFTRIASTLSFWIAFKTDERLEQRLQVSRMKRMQLRLCVYNDMSWYLCSSPTWWKESIKLCLKVLVSFDCIILVISYRKAIRVTCVLHYLTLGIGMFEKVGRRKWSWPVLLEKFWAFSI